MNAIQPITSVETMSSSDVAKNWLAAHSPKTLLVYRDSMKSMAKSFAVSGEELCAQLLSSKGQASIMVLQYKQWMVKNKAAAATVNVRLASIRSFIEFANTVGHINWRLTIKGLKDAPFRDTEGPGVDGIKAMLALADAHGNIQKARRDVAIIWLLFGCALRLSELTSLNVGHFDGNRLAVLRKGGMQRQWVPVPKAAVTALSAWINGRADKEDKGFKDAPMFARAHHSGRMVGRLGNVGVWKIIKTIGLKATGHHVHPHGFRHTAITVALDVFGGDCRKVARFSGHKSLAMVERYDDRKNQSGAEVAEKISELI